MRFAVLLFFLLPVLAQASVREAAEWRSIWLEASEFPAFVQGQPVKKLSLVRWDNQHFVPVPFQFDEMNQNGLVYLSDKQGSIDGVEGEFDSHDQLGFMWRDAGVEQAPATAKSARGDKLLEIAVRLAEEPVRYVYLLKNAPERNDMKYVDHDFDSGITFTPRYVLKVAPDNELHWNDFRFQGYTGVGSIIKELRMRMSGRMLSRFSPAVVLDNNNLKPQLVAKKQGPIRTIMLLRIRVVVLGIPVMSIYEQVSRYASRYQAITHTHIPALYRATLKDPHVAVSFVGNDLLNSTLETALSEGERLLVDGSFSKAEKALVKHAIDNAHNWVYFDSQQQFVMVNRLDIPDYLSTVPVSLVYEEKAQPDGRDQLLPNVGYAIDAWPEEKQMLFGLDLFFDNALHGLTPQDYLNIRAQKPWVQFNTF